MKSRLLNSAHLYANFYKACVCTARLVYKNCEFCRPFYKKFPIRKNAMLLKYNKIDLLYQTYHDHQL
jgi:hypothetical protein